jgi:hypothetical protein
MVTLLLLLLLLKQQGVCGWQAAAAIAATSAADGAATAGWLNAQVLQCQLQRRQRRCHRGSGLCCAVSSEDGVG